MINESAFLVLNAIYLKKMGANEQIAAISGLPLDEVRGLTETFSVDEKLFEMPDGVMLMPSGTDAVLEYYRETYREFRDLPEATRWYERFETVNQRFIALVSEWQQLRDEKTEDRMFQQVAKLIKQLGEIVGRIPRYGEYIRRFENSMGLVDRGDKQYVCSPSVDSVHNVWFEFHEDILAVLGRPRDTT